tara:strand:+ start:136 stop:486 length:351 start_codon:yes stop_codon:yes gene_type:complete
MNNHKEIEKKKNEVNKAWEFLSKQCDEGIFTKEEFNEMALQLNDKLRELDNERDWVWYEFKVRRTYRIKLQSRSQAEEHFEELGWKLCDATEFNRQQGGEIAEEKNGKVKEIGKGL